jgi:calcineurin-like phosphoesterase family protein
MTEDKMTRGLDVLGPGMDAEREFNFDRWRVGKTYWTSDWHWGHERIIELCNRPFKSIGEMNREILDRVNSVVTSRDTLVILGDVIMGRFEETVKLLAQVQAKRIWILPGNHDRFSLAYRNRGGPEAQRTARELWRLEYEQARSVRGRVIRAEEDRVPSVWGAEIGGEPVAISHYPYAGDSGKTDRHRWLRPVDQGLPLIHGHVHGAWRTQGRMFNVGVDVNDFAPVGEDVLSAWLERLRMKEYAG